MQNEHTGEPIKVIIADDHVLYRAGVKTALSAKKDVKVVAEADNGMHLLNMLKMIPVDVILWIFKCRSWMVSPLYRK